jgi:multicomponent Na+:H+ antiporter subunit F
MLNITLTICLALLLITMVFVIIRIIRGPRVLDRFMSIDAIAICIIGTMIILSIRWQTSYFIDLILVFSLLNFIGFVAFAFYVNRTYSKEDFKLPKGGKHE